MLNPTLHKFLFSVLSSGVFQPTATWSKCQYIFTMFFS